MISPTNPLEGLLSIQDVAGILRVHPRTVHRLIDRGELPHIRIGRSIRVRPDDLKSYIARQRIG